MKKAQHSVLLLSYMVATSAIISQPKLAHACLTMPCPFHDTSTATMRVTICNRISSTATFFLNSELKSMAGGKCGGYTLPAGSTFKTSYGKNGQRFQVLVNLEGVTYDLVKYSSGDIELRRR